ncbi:MAG: RNA polymerase sigma factor [Rhodospirillaceae bacterium]
MIGGNTREEGSAVGDDDRTLLALIGRGDHRAFQTLMRAHMPFTLRLAYRVIGNRDDAEEVAQEAFLRVWTMAPRWRHDLEARFTTWLYRVVVNLCLDRRRRLVPLPLEDAGDTADPAPDSLDRVAADETTRLVAHALDGLPPRQRAAISLCYYGGVNGPQAAEILEVSVSALESLLVRGRRALRLRLTGLGALERVGESQ